MSPEDAKLTIKKTTLAAVQAAVHSITSKDLYKFYAPFAFTIANVIWTVLQALGQSGPSGVFKLIKMNEAVVAITAKIKSVLPVVYQTLQAKLESFLVQVLKKLT